MASSKTNAARFLDYPHRPRTGEAVTGGVTGEEAQDDGTVLQAKARG